MWLYVGNKNKIGVTLEKARAFPRQKHRAHADPARRTVALTMAILGFLLNLAGATMLLLFAVRMVRTGIERRYGASFQRLMTRERNLLPTALIGTSLAVILQSSAAVALLAAGFAASGYLGFGTGLAIVLGADLGSALIIQVLSFDLDWLLPLLLAVGGWLFVNTEARKWRQFGRILLGIAFILLALRLLREAMDPIRDAAFLPSIANYLARDYVTAFIVGAGLTFAMHSSVAAILICVTLVEISVIPFAAGLSLVLGANLGSALIPIWLTRRMSARARRIPLANLLIRGVLATLAVVAINLALRAGHLPMPETGQALVLSHIGFNAIMAFIALPFVRALEAPMTRLVAAPMGGPDNGLPNPMLQSALDYEVIDRPALAIPSMKKELLRMANLIEAMFRPVLDLYRSGDKARIAALRDMDHAVNDCLSGLREFIAAIPRENFTKDQNKISRDLMEYAIRLETAGDVVSKRMTDLAREKSTITADFSRDGWAELTHMHEACLANLHLATNVLVSDDLESARLLSLEKTELKRAERDSRKRHLKRLQQGRTESLETSDVHLETLRAFREFNSHIAAVAYPLLYRHGQLLETRLIEDMNGGTDT